MRIPALGLLAFVAATPLPAQSRAGIADLASLAFTTSAEGMLIVPATLGATIPLQVILDTGAGLDILAPSLIRKVNGKAAGAFTGIRMTGDRVDVPLFVVPELALGPIVRTHVVVGGWDTLDSLHIDGIISVNGLRHQPFTIDFADKVLTFETEQSLAQRRASGHSTSLQLSDERGKALDLFAGFLIGNQTGECELDTGSQGATVSTRFMAPLGVDTSSYDVARRLRRTITGATEIRYVAGVSRISLATSPEVGLAQPRVTFSDIIYDCVIGTAFWSGRALTLDIPSRQLTVSPPRVGGGAPSH